jgi:hypothetical protein
MIETVRLWSQDYSEVLFTTEDREAAKQWFLTSGHDWLPIVIDYGTDWAQRWSGRLELTDGQVAINQDRKYLKYMIEWPSWT